MKIHLSKLRLKNFKGSGLLEIQLSNKTIIYGENAAGKTRILDAFTWLLFGKDSEDKADFAIKPIDKTTNDFLHNLDVEVEGWFEINGRQTIMMKVFKEKWTKKKGELEAELTGHETTYYMEGIAIPKKNYDVFVDSISSIEKFRYCTDPTYFESQNWIIKRKILFDICPIKSDIEIANGNPDFEALIQEFNGKDIQEMKKNLSVMVRKMNDEIKLLPPRIDEQKSSMPQQIDFDSIRKQQKGAESMLFEIESQINSNMKAFEAKNQQVQEQKKELLLLKNKLDDLKAKLQAEIDSLGRNELQSIESKKLSIEMVKDRIRNYSKDLEANNIEISSIESKIALLRTEWYQIRDNEFKLDASKTICPTCSRTLDNYEGIIDTLKLNFNQQKVSDIKEIEKKAESFKEKITTLKRLNDGLNSQIDSQKENILLLESEIQELTEKCNQIPKSIETTLFENQEYQSLLKQFEEKKSLIPEAVTPESDNDLLLKKFRLIDEIDEFKNQLRNEELIATSYNRIAEIESEIRDKGQKIADLERQIFTIEQFTEKKISLIESHINAKFKYVQFKMYNQLMNGGQEETCITLINGVPYNSANYAGRINAGLDIINVLSEHFDIQAPCFIDNAESISYPLEMNTQVIRLFKKEGQMTLKIEHDEQ